MKAKNGNIFLALDAAKLSLHGLVMVPIPFLFLVSIFLPADLVGSFATLV